MAVSPRACAWRAAARRRAGRCRQRVPAAPTGRALRSACTAASRSRTPASPPFRPPQCSRRMPAGPGRHRSARQGAARSRQAPRPRRDDQVRPSGRARSDRRGKAAGQRQAGRRADSPSSVRVALASADPALGELRGALGMARVRGREAALESARNLRRERPRLGDVALDRPPRAGARGRSARRTL